MIGTIRKGAGAILAFGTEGLTPAQTRQINVVTVAALLGIGIAPFYAIFFAVYDYSRLLLPIKLALVTPLPSPPLPSPSSHPCCCWRWGGTWRPRSCWRCSSVPN